MAARSHSELTVAVIHYQTPALLERCLASLRSSATESRVLVVDTGETEPLPAEWPASHPGVELLRQPNHSYSAAVNAALRQCSTSRFAQLNSDLLVTPTTFDDLARALDESGAAMAGPLMRDGNGRLQRQGLPYRRYQWLARKAAAGWTAVPWLSGSLQYLSMSSALLVGGMDSNLRFYNEDLEWCLRMRSAGLRCLLVNTEVVHLGGSSTPSSPAFLIEGLRGGYQLTRRYRGPVARGLHRAGLIAASSTLARFARQPERRSAFRRLTAMLRSGGMEESPFGPTLGSDNPCFGRVGAPS